MNRLIIVTLFIISSLTVTAQQKLNAQVLDAKSQKAVPFATVKNESQNRGGFTSEAGFIFIEAQPGDTLEIQSLGYYTKRIVVLDTLNLANILLEPNDHVLKEVTITASRKRGKKTQYGYHKSSKDSYTAYNVPIGFQIGVYIPNNNHMQGYVDKAYFRLKKVGLEESMFRIRVYKFDPLTMLPGEEITNQQIIETVRLSKGNLSVDLSPYSIEFPREGIVLALEFLGEKNNLGQFVKKYEHFKLQIAKSKNDEQNLTFYKNISFGWGLYPLKATNGSSTNAMFGIEVSVNNN